MVLLYWIFDLTRNSSRLLSLFLSFYRQPSHYILHFGNLIHFCGFDFYFYEHDSPINISKVNFPLSFSFTQPPACWTTPPRCFAGISILDKFIKVSSYPYSHLGFLLLSCFCSGHYCPSKFQVPNFEFSFYSAFPFFYVPTAFQTCQKKPLYHFSSPFPMPSPNGSLNLSYGKFS